MIGVSLVSPKGTEKQSSCLLAYLKKIGYLSKYWWQNPPFLQSGTKCGNHGNHPVLCVLWEGQAFRPHLQGGLQTFQTGQLDTTACDTHNIDVFTCVSSFSCSQVRMSDSLGLLSQILEMDRFALVVQEPQQGNTKLSITPAEWWRPFVVEQKETSIHFILFARFPPFQINPRGQLPRRRCWVLWQRWSCSTTSQLTVSRVPLPVSNSQTQLHHPPLQGLRLLQGDLLKKPNNQTKQQPFISLYNLAHYLSASE